MLGRIVHKAGLLEVPRDRSAATGQTPATGRALRLAESAAARALKEEQLVGRPTWLLVKEKPECLCRGFDYSPVTLRRDSLRQTPLVHLNTSEGLFDGRGQRVVIGVEDEDGEQLCRLGLARVAAD